MVECGVPGQAAMRCFKMILVTFLLLFAGAFSAQQSAPSDSGALPEAGAPPPAERVLQPTRESIYRHLAAELQHAVGAEEHIKGVFAGLAAGIEESVTHTVMPSLQGLIDTVVERAEDAWVTADDAGRTVHVKECVDGAEYDAQQVAKRAVEKMRGCVDALQHEGDRRIREAARLLAEIESISKRFVTALESCVREEEAKAKAQPDAAPGDSPIDVGPNSESDAPAANSGTDAETAIEGIDTASTCSKDSAQESSGTSSCGCSKCKKGKPKTTTSQEAAQTSEDEISLEDATESKRKCRKGEKCEKLQKSKDHKEEKAFETQTLKQDGKKKKDQKYKKVPESVKDEQNQATENQAAAEEQEQATAKNMEKQSREEKVSKKDKTLEKEKKKKGKKNEEQSQVTEDNEISVEEPVEKTGKQEKNPDGKNKKEKKYGKKDESKTKGKKEKNNEGSMEGKGRKKRDLLAIQETPDETQESAETPEQPSAEQPESLASDAKASPKWPTEGSTPEEKHVIACLQSAAMKPLMDEKTRAYQKLQGMLKRVQDKQQEAPATCVTDHVHKAELKINAIKTRMASCAERKMRSDL